MVLSRTAHRAPAVAPFQAASVPTSRTTLITPKAGAALAVGGAVTVGVVVIALLLPARIVHAGGGEAAPPPRPSAPPTGIVVDGDEGVEVHPVTYAPGQSSSWHRHTGIHAVAVLSGTLTVYGPDCQAHRYGPGEAYVGGRELHLARNEGESPLEMSVTYLFPPGSSMADFLIQASAPPACPIP